jgi:hypothetical protein
MNKLLNWTFPFIIIIVVFILSSCRDNSYCPLPDYTGYIARPDTAIAIPSRGVSGQKVKVVYRVKEKSYKFESLEFNNISYPVDSLRGDTIYFTSPYMSEFFNSRIVFSKSSEEKKVMQCGYTPYPEVLNSAVEIRWNDLDPVGENSSLFLGKAKWSCTENGNYVILNAMCNISNDTSGVSRIIFKDNGIYKLPSFIGYYSENNIEEIKKSKRNSLTRGIVKIDNWSLTGIISGTIYSDFTDQNFLPYITKFYINRSK